MEERRRVNEQIRIAQIMVIDENGSPVGVMTPEDGRRLAFEKGMDLVEVAPQARPPVCKIMDYGRFRYEQRKKHKKQHQAETKIIKLRPKTDKHDLETKLRHARGFLEDGDRVRFIVRMRGRERAVTERWEAALNDLLSKLVDIGIITGKPMLEGGGVCATVEPKKNVGKAVSYAEPEDDDDGPDDLAVPAVAGAVAVPGTAIAPAGSPPAEAPAAPPATAPTSEGTPTVKS